MAQPPPPVPPFDHIFIVIMENHGYGEIIGSPDAPFINQLAARYGVATNYVSVAHPSLPNYLALTGGDTFGITTDCTGCFQQAPNLVVDRIAHPGAPGAPTWSPCQRQASSATPTPTCKNTTRSSTTTTCAPTRRNWPTSSPSASSPPTWPPRQPPQPSAGSPPTCSTTCTTGPSRKAMPGYRARSRYCSPPRRGPSSGPCCGS